MRWNMRSAIWFSVVSATMARATNLADDRTTARVLSALLADNFIHGIALSAASITADAATNNTVPASNTNPGKSGLNFCTVIYLPLVNPWFWLPAPDRFKTRYLSTSGIGSAITSGQNGLTAGIVCGAVTGTTDGGFSAFDKISDVLLLANGTLNYNMHESFAYKSIHKMSLLGEEPTRKF